MSSPYPFIYTRPTDRLAGTLAVETGTAAVGYPADYLDDNQPHLPAKLVETSGAWTRDFGAPTQVDFCAVIHHNLNVGVVVRLQGHGSNVWTSPDVNLQLVLPPAHADGFTSNLWADVATAVPLAASRTKQWWRLVVVTANAVPVAVGEWAMYSAVRNLGIRNISKGSQRQVHRPAIIHQTELLVRRSYDLGTSLRRVQVAVEATDTYRADIEEWWRSASGEVKPFVIVPHRDEDEAWFVTFLEQNLGWARDHMNYNPLTLQFQEVSRGLTL